MNRAAAIFVALTAGVATAGPHTGFFPPPKQEPFVQESCISVPEIPATLINGWENYGPPFKPASFYKDCFGIVRLSGGIKHEKPEGGGTAFTLPEAYRPMGHEIYATGGTGYRGDVYITPDGGVLPVGKWVGTLTSLSGMTFRQ